MMRRAYETDALGVVLARVSKLWVDVLILTDERAAEDAPLLGTCPNISSYFSRDVPGEAVLVLVRACHHGSN